MQTVATEIARHEQHGGRSTNTLKKGEGIVGSGATLSRWCVLTELSKEGFEVGTVSRFVCLERDRECQGPALER